MKIYLSPRVPLSYAMAAFARLAGNDVDIQGARVTPFGVAVVSAEPTCLWFDVVGPRARPLGRVCWSWEADLESMPTAWDLVPEGARVVSVPDGPAWEAVAFAFADAFGAIVVSGETGGVLHPASKTRVCGRTRRDADWDFRESLPDLVRSLAPALGEGALR